MFERNVKYESISLWLLGIVLEEERWYYKVLCWLLII